MGLSIQGSILGNSVKRTEDRELLTGAGQYTADLPADGAYYVVFVRSPIAHGELTGVDTEEAKSMPGVRAVYSGDDLGLNDRAGLPPVTPDAMTRPMFARGKVRFVGDIVAAVVADSLAEAMDAAEAVDVDIDPLPAVVDLEAALAEDAPLLFEEHGSNQVSAGGTDDVPGLFDDAEHVIEHTFYNQRLAGVPMEPNGCLVVPGEPDGDITVWLSTQSPHAQRDTLAGDLGLTNSQVRVIAPRVGGGFGPKSYGYTEYTIAAAAARALNNPVRWTENRSENLLSMVHGRGQVQHIKLGMRGDGRIVGLRAEIIADTGAYPMLGAVLPNFTQMMSQGVYDIPAVEVKWRTVATNTTVIGPYRGAGRPEATQFLERIIDIAADELELDPLEIRRINFLRADDFPLKTHTGASYDSGEYEKALDAVAAAAGYQELRAEQRRRIEAGERVLLGIGVASYVEVTAPPGTHKEFGSVQAHPDGTFTAMAGTSAHGQGHETAYAQVVAHVLNVPMDRVRLVQSDTAQVASGVGTFGSRSLQTAGSAIHTAGEELIAQAREIAAHLLEAAVDDIELTDEGLGVRGAPGSELSWAALAEAAENGTGRPDGSAAPLLQEHDFEQGQPSFPFGAHVAVVEVDLDTGMVRQLRHVAVDDCGRIVNPLLVTGQQHGGIAQGISQALFEKVGYDEDGNLTTGNLASYVIPSAADLPSFEVSNTETPTHLNPLGAKGIGESGTIGSTPAVHNAVIDAVAHLGVRHIDMPLTSDVVWHAIRDAG